MAAHHHPETFLSLRPRVQHPFDESRFDPHTAQRRQLVTALIENATSSPANVDIKNASDSLSPYRRNAALPPLSSASHAKFLAASSNSFTDNSSLLSAPNGYLSPGPPPPNAAGASFPAMMRHTPLTALVTTDFDDRGSRLLARVHNAANTTMTSAEEDDTDHVGDDDPAVSNFSATSSKAAKLAAIGSASAKGGDVLPMTAAAMRCSPYMFYHGEDDAFRRAQLEYSIDRRRWLNEKREAIEKGGSTGMMGAKSLLPPELVSPPKRPLALRGEGGPAVLELIGADDFSAGTVSKALSTLEAPDQHALQDMIKKLLAMNPEPAMAVVAKPAIRLCVFQEATAQEIYQTALRSPTPAAVPEPSTKGSASAKASHAADAESDPAAENTDNGQPYYQTLSSFEHPYFRAAVVSVTKLRQLLERTFDVSNRVTLDTFFREMDRKREGTIPLVTVLQLLEDYLTTPGVVRAARHVFSCFDEHRHGSLSLKTLKTWRGGPSNGGAAPPPLPPAVSFSMAKSLLGVWHQTPADTPNGAPLIASSTMSEEQFVNLFYAHETATPRLVAGCLEAVMAMLVSEKFGVPFAVLNAAQSKSSR